MSNAAIASSTVDDGHRPAVDALRANRRFSAVQLLIVLAIMLIAIPFVESLEYGAMLESGLVTAVLLSAVIAIGGRRRMRLTAIALVAPAVISRWLHHFRPDVVPDSISTAATIAFAGFVVLALLRFVYGARLVDANVLCAASSAYLMIGLLWAFGYMLISQLIPNAFAFQAAGPAQSSQRMLIGFEAIYFSFATLTTVGYGDIAPVAKPARLLAMTEAVSGVFFMTVLIARLVTLYTSGARRVL